MFVEGLLPVARERLVTVPHDAPLIDAATHLARSQINLVVVCDSDAKIVGVLTKTDVVRQMSRCGGSSCTTAAALVMTRDVVVCRPQDWLPDVWASMNGRGLKHVPVVDEASQPIGVLYARDALQVLLREVESEELLLRDYVLGIGYR